MPAFPTNSLIFFPCACWSEGCFFGHWRSDVTFPLIAGGATRRAIRKHRAPNGALRQIEMNETCFFIPIHQKAPSAKRCIKTFDAVMVRVAVELIRKHRAPNGALRLFELHGVSNLSHIRKHRAPKGALRLDKNTAVAEVVDLWPESTERQKAH